MTHNLKLFQNTIKKVGNSCSKYNLLSPNDKILIGLSGGKDSLFLMEAMAQIVKKLNYKVELIACHIHISEIGYKVDVNWMRSVCEKLNISLIVSELSVNLFENPQKTPCFVCSWYRRKKLFEIAKNLSCNKLALGHHANDAIETLLLNMIYHGSISSIPSKLTMFEGRMQLIRPLIELTDRTLTQISDLRNYPLPIYNCPYGDKTKRNEIRTLLKNLESTNKNALKNIFRSMSQIYFEYLPEGKRNY